MKRQGIYGFSDILVEKKPVGLSHEAPLPFNSKTFILKEHGDSQCGFLPLKDLPTNRRKLWMNLFPLLTVFSYPFLRIEAFRKYIDSAFSTILHVP